MAERLLDMTKKPGSRFTDEPVFSSITTTKPDAAVSNAAGFPRTARSATIPNAAGYAGRANAASCT